MKQDERSARLAEIRSGPNRLEIDYRSSGENVINKMIGIDQRSR